MPELPDVEVFKQYFQSTSLYHTMDRVEFSSERLLKDGPPEKYRDYLEGSSFRNTSRHGKYLFLDVSDQGWLGLHFGMTGRLKYYQADGDRPEYAQGLFCFDHGYNLALVMPRKLGAMYLIDQRREFIERKDLGPDVLNETFDQETFLEILSGSRAMVKSDLMNQQKMAGIGNVYSDEILFQAKIHPETPVRDLNREDKVHLFQTMQKVLKVAINENADPELFPEVYLTGHRDEGEPCPRCGENIKRKKVIGRSSYFCPNCQRKA